MISKTEGLVLRGYRMSESSKVVVIYTRTAGKVRVVARGARRPRSKFGASVEPITWGAYVFYSRENRELQTLSEGDILYPFEGIKRVYRRLVYASAVCDLLDRLTPEEDANSLLCSVTLETLRWMETVEEQAVELPLWYFQLKAAAGAGLSSPSERMRPMWRSDNRRQGLFRRRAWRYGLPPLRKRGPWSQNGYHPIPGATSDCTCRPNRREGFSRRATPTKRVVCYAAFCGAILETGARSSRWIF